MSVNWVERAKLASVRRALDSIKTNATLGLGSGSTVELAIPLIAKLSREKGITVRCIPSSSRIESVAIRNGLSVISTNDIERIQLAIDGADQLHQSTLDMIKGGGGALLREKILDTMADKVLIVVDERKVTLKLGTGVPIPVEVLPFAHGPLANRIREMGGKPELRMKDGISEPAVTDNGNYILDVHFLEVPDLKALERNWHGIPGIIETGLFLGVCDVAYVGRRDGSVDVLTPKL